MKTKTSQQQKQSKPAVQLKDIKPKKDAKGDGPKIRHRMFSIVDRTN